MITSVFYSFVYKIHRMKLSDDLVDRRDNCKVEFDKIKKEYLRQTFRCN